MEGGTGRGQTDKLLSGLWSGLGFEAEVREENYYRSIKKQMYKVKKILYLTICLEKAVVTKKEGGLAGVIFLLYIICKYQENEVRLKCILNILNF